MEWKKEVKFYMISPMSEDERLKNAFINSCKPRIINQSEMSANANINLCFFRNVCEKYGVWEFPAILFFDKRGKF